MAVLDKHGNSLQKGDTVKIEFIVTDVWDGAFRNLGLMVVGEFQEDEVKPSIILNSEVVEKL